MGLLRSTVGDLVVVAGDNKWWMTWNLLLAAVPAVLAVALFRLGGRRTPVWWVGAVLFVLFLPNAPYVVTDLIHLRGDVLLVESDRAVVFAVLPIYAVFVAAGFLAYHVSLAELGRYLSRIGREEWRPRLDLGAHALCAVGVYLGRVARLNSWEPVTEPHGTLERIVTTLSWRGAPLAIVTLFLVILVGTAATALVVDALRRSLSRWTEGVVA